jgi:uncharacterized protein YlxP (DUF503 family)
MTEFSESLDTLVARLPNLAWKLKTLYSFIPAHLLPTGLFNERLEMTPEICIEEINEDLKAMALQQNERSIKYIAERVSRKINVLVQLCQKEPDHDSKRAFTFTLQSISTRQQWLDSVREEISQLIAQQHALQKSLTEALKNDPTSPAIIALRAEIGKLEERLTLARETLAQR